MVLGVLLEPRYFVMLYSFPHRPSVTYEDYFLNEDNAHRDASYRRDEGYDVLLLDPEGEEVALEG